MDVFKVLDELAIAYQKFEHAAVFTCEAADQLNLDADGAKTKNLFLTDRRGKRHFLVVVSDAKTVDLKSLSVVLETSALRFGSAERLQKYLSTTPGSVSILDLLNDPEQLVKLVIDDDIWQADALQCHPLRNTATLVIRLADMRRLLGHLNREALVLRL